MRAQLMKHFLSILILFFFLCFTSVSYAETQVFFSPNGGCQKEVLAEINKAHESIEIAMYELTSKDIAQAIIAAKDRKVKIKITLDSAQLKDRYSKSRYLMGKGINVKFHLGPGLMHNKFAIIDDQVVLTGSFNWTLTAEKKNCENLVVITDKDLALDYSKEFKHLWSQSGEGTAKKIKSLE